MHKYGKLKTTVEIDDQLFREAKARAALQGKRLRDLVEEGLRLVLDQADVPGRRRRGLHLPLIKASSPVKVNFTSADLAFLDLQEDEQRHAPPC